ncbi:hypothetical protein H4Q26_006161 [Puccinia striiformis f. sp. tritici PST-130]|nr:hypothetical protein H4Q26_006161 [Puccinia striiformis f. sp. tritici PST-130]
MGVSLVARVEGVGADAFQLIADRLLRDHQAPARERWLAVIRSLRQPIPPIEDAPTVSERQKDASDARNRGRKQRTMYCLRHSGRPGELIAMIEDAEAPNRRAQDATIQRSHLSSPLDPIGNPVKLMSDTILEDAQHKDGDQPPTNTNGAHPENLPIAMTAEHASTDMAVDNAIAPIKNDSDTTTPSHYRVSIVSVPDSFEQLLSSAICAPQTTLIPSAWCPRPNIIAIEGMSWGIYSSSFESEIGPGSNLGPMSSTMSTKESQPDWWIRLGTVTNKGASSGSISLPWLMLELECATSPIELDPSSEFLESVLHALIKPDRQLLVKPFRPTEQDLIEAGLTSEESNLTSSPNPPKTASLRNGYCMLMLAKQESLI